MNKIGGSFLSMLLVCSLMLCGCGAAASSSETVTSAAAETVTSEAAGSLYADPANWAYAETDAEGKAADVFFITPTVYMGDEDNLVWTEFDEKTKASFLGSINMEKGIYDDNARFFAPYYHQGALSAYYAEESESSAVFDAAYAEVKEAFEYYLQNYNEGRPFLIAGFSQGAQLGIRLMEEYAGTEAFDSLLIACYAVGWRFTEEEQEQYPNVKFASGEEDTGVLIAFDCEDPEITDTLMIPAGTKTLAINPLNWKTDGTAADKSLNLGACFTDYDGNIKSEIPELTGAYIDEARGALKATDIEKEDYPGVLFEDGIYHLYDYEFFYRNLEKNVQDRISAYMEENGDAQ